MMRCEVTFAALEACVTASSLTKRWQDRFCCILKNSTKVQVSSFKPKPVFILTDNINYRCCQSIYIVALIVLEHYLYMMLSEEKLLSAACFGSLILMNRDVFVHLKSTPVYHRSISSFSFSCFQLLSIVQVRGVSKKEEMKVKSRSY